MPTGEELRAKYIEQLAALKAEETLSRDISRVVRVAQIRQQVYANALPAAEAGVRIENLEWWSRTVKIIAVTAVGAAVAAAAAPYAIAYLSQVSGTALTWLSSNVTVTVTTTIAGKALPLAATVSAGTLALSIPLSYTTGLKWPAYFPEKLSSTFSYKGPREENALDHSSALGLFFEWRFRTKVAGAIDAIERDFMGRASGAWPGWENVKIIPAIIQDEHQFIVALDTAIYRQIISSGAKPGEAYLSKVQICLGFWKKLEDDLIRHRITHNYQASIARLQASVATCKAELSKRWL